MPEKNTLNIDYNSSDDLKEELQNASPGDILITKVKHRVRRNDNGNMVSDIVGVILQGNSVPITKAGTTPNEGSNTSPTLADEKLADERLFDEAK